MTILVQNPPQTTLDLIKSGSFWHAMLAVPPKGGALISPPRAPASGLPLKGGAELGEMPDRAEGGALHKIECQ